MAKVIITQVRSRIGSTKNQRANLDALGLRKINQTVQHDDSAIILGMLNKVKHLVKFEIVEGEKPAKKAAPKAEKAEAPKAETPKAEVKAEAKAEEKPAAEAKAEAKTEPKAEKAPAEKKPAAKKAAPKKEAAPAEEGDAEPKAE